jgi:hypothetical protein
MHLYLSSFLLGNEADWEGLGLYPYCIARHYKSDHPESTRVDAMVEYFIAIISTA